MADLDNRNDLDAAEREEEEARRRQKRATLDEEIARKYDADRLSKMVVRGAGRGERLDLTTRLDMERRLPGHDFSKVRVFRGALAEEITKRHQADAVTVANTGMILMRQGPRSAPGTRAHQALLAHELTHVAQAQRGMHFALEHGGGEGEHEQEAQAVEHGVAHGEHESSASNSPEARAARERMIIERAIELLEEHHQIAEERKGRL